MKGKSEYKTFALQYPDESILQVKIEYEIATEDDEDSTAYRQVKELVSNHLLDPMQEIASQIFDGTETEDDETEDYEIDLELEDEE